MYISPGWLSHRSSVLVEMEFEDFIFGERGKLENLETLATMVGGVCSHQCFISAPLRALQEMNFMR